MEGIVISQSLIKGLEALGHPDIGNGVMGCPKKFHSFYISKDQERDPSDMQNKGLYFEYLCTGGGLRGRDKPPTARGVDKERIEYNAALFKRLFNPDDPMFMGYEITNTDVMLGPVELVDMHGRPYMASGIGDILAIDTATEKEIYIDMKLTKDSEAKFGPFPWGDLPNMDTIQLWFYKKMFAEQLEMNVDTAYLVFDISTTVRAPKLIHVDHTDQTIELFEKRVSEAIDMLEMYENEKWEWVLPSYNECGSCKLDCKFRDMVMPEKKSITK